MLLLVVRRVRRTCSFDPFPPRPGHAAKVQWLQQVASLYRRQAILPVAKGLVFPFIDRRPIPISFRETSSRDAALRNSGKVNALTQMTRVEGGNGERNARSEPGTFRNPLVSLLGRFLRLSFDHRAYWVPRGSRFGESKKKAILRADRIDKVETENSTRTCTSDLVKSNFR